MISDYFNEVERQISKTKVIVEKNIDYKEFGSKEGMVRLSASHWRRFSRSFTRRTNWL